MLHSNVQYFCSQCSKRIEGTHEWAASRRETMKPKTRIGNPASEEDPDECND